MEAVNEIDDNTEILQDWLCVCTFCLRWNAVEHSEMVLGSVCWSRCMWCCITACQLLQITVMPHKAIVKIWQLPNVITISPKIDNQCKDHFLLFFFFSAPDCSDWCLIISWPVQPEWRSNICQMFLLSLYHSWGRQSVSRSNTHQTWLTTIVRYSQCEDFSPARFWLQSVVRCIQPLWRSDPCQIWLQSVVRYCIQPVWRSDTCQIWSQSVVRYCIQPVWRSDICQLWSYQSWMRYIACLKSYHLQMWLLPSVVRYTVSIKNWHLPKVIAISHETESQWEGLTSSKHDH